MEKCRACLTTEGLMFPMNEQFICNYNILTNLDVKSSDEMPQVVCETCLQSITFFINFREKCILSETSLRSIGANVKVEKMQEPGQNIKQEYEIHCDESYMDSGEFNEDINIVIKKEDVEEPKKIARQYKRTKQKTTKKIVKDLQKSNLKIKSQLVCGICPKEFLSKSQLLDHLEDHKTNWKCWLCSEVLKSWAQMLGHRVIHVPKDQKCCHICSKRFLTQAGLEFHIRKVHFNEKNIQLTCNTCFHLFETPRKLYKHKWAIHSNINYICDYCGKIYSNKHTLRAHIRSHSSIKKYTCNMCDFSCKYTGNLKDHIIRKHTAKRVTCRDCKRVFEDQEKCDQHRCNTKPPYVCTVCGLELRRGISRHMESHKEVGRYKCSKCPKAYKARGALAVHMNQHEGNRNQRCEFCPATFYHPSVLGKHRRIHTGEKPYVCKICNRGFTGNHNLKVHMKVHGEHNLIVKRVKPEIVEA